MAFERARVALAALEEKLRRQLGLAGEIGTSFLPELTPVLIAGDLREAGNASHKGRAWSWFYNGAAGAGFTTFQALRFEQDVRVDKIMLANSGALQTIRCWITAPDQAPAVAVTTLAGSWTDRKTIGTDQVPLTQGVPGALTGTAETDQNRIVSAPIANGAVVFEVNVMVPAGGALNFTGGGVNVMVGAMGRIWP